MLGLALARAQEPGVSEIRYDSIVEDGIEENAIFDWWLIDVEEGDMMVMEMRGSDGLAPLIGLLDPGGQLVARSADGIIDGDVLLEYTAEASGQYIVVATRAGNENGTTTGNYWLRVRRANTPRERVNPYQQVVFRCQAMEVTNVLTLEFNDDAPLFYRVNVYGMDDFLPVIRVEIDSLGLTDCSRDSQAMGGDSYTLPGAETVVLEGDEPEQVAQLAITGAQQAGNVTLTVGSENGLPGRYVVVVEGFRIDPANDRDRISIGQGPLAASVPLLVYMVGSNDSRLDPVIEAESPVIVCDDVGRRGCDDIPAISGLRVTIGDDVVITGDRFDAGALLPAGTPQLYTLELGSFSGNTSGDYSLVILGEMPTKGEE